MVVSLEQVFFRITEELTKSILMFKKEDSLTCMPLAEVVCVLFGKVRAGRTCTLASQTPVIYTRSLDRTVLAAVSQLPV